jgi:hypothetical protein
MAAFIAFAGMLLLSLVTSLIAAFQLGDFFGAGEEFPLVIGWVAAFGALTLVVFGIGYRLAPNVRALNILAFVLAMLALVPPVAPGFVQGIAEHSANPYTIGVERTYIRLQLVVPTLLAILVQWGLVRGRWLRDAGQDELSLWPWVTTMVASLVVLNPYGLTFLAGTIRHSPTDFMWQSIAIATAAMLALLLVMAWVECYIRDRILDHRQAAGPPDRAGTVRPHGL